MSSIRVSGRVKAKARPKEKNGDSLIPGMPDKIILTEIVPKLPWRAVDVLFSVSPAWRHAIQSRQVYTARVRTKSLETLILLHGQSENFTGIALYSVRDSTFHPFHLLPPFPRSLAIPRYDKCKCVAVDGKLYLLGAVYDASFHSHYVYDSSLEIENGVYELDLAGQKKWKECVRMKWGRKKFACGVMDGKIYVFQGSNAHKPVTRSECYDPKLDAWSALPIRIPPLRFGHKTVTVGEEFFLYGGRVFDLEYARRRLAGYPVRAVDRNEDSDGDSDEDSDCDSEDYDDRLLRFPSEVEVYNPIKDDWRAVTPQREKCGVLFTADGKLFSMDDFGIDIYDPDRESWAALYVHSFAALLEAPFDEIGAVSLTPFSALFVDGELFAVVTWVTDDVRHGEALLLGSTGLGGESKEIVWQKFQTFPSWFDSSSVAFDMSTLEL